jgi:hypothetical protein
MGRLGYFAPFVESRLDSPANNSKCTRAQNKADKQSYDSYSAYFLEIHASSSSTGTQTDHYTGRYRTPSVTRLRLLPMSSLRRLAIATRIPGVLKLSLYSLPH